MKKNILLLINGFGIEKNDSTPVYSAELMPNMDRLTTERIFASIPNSYLDYKSSYRNFSMGIDGSLSYGLIDNNINNSEISNNQLLKYITNETVKYNSRLHIFCFWDSDRSIEQLVTYIKEIQKSTKAKIFLHLVFCQKSLNDYKDIIRNFTSLSYDMGMNVKIGTVFGENILSNSTNLKDLVKLLITEFGEKWKDIAKKTDVLIQTKTAPCNTRPFGVNADFKFLENDQVLFFNYTNVDISLFRKELYAQRFRQMNLDNVPFYSLFPVNAEKQIPFMYNFAVASTYMLNSIKSINARCLVMDKKEKCPYINYYLTGLRNSVDDNLKYYPIDETNMYDGNKLLEIIKSYDKELIIINYDISESKTLEELKDKLNKIDAVIGLLDAYIRENKQALFISSLYGVEKDVLNSRQEIKKINFSGRVPVIIDDEDYAIGSYSVSEGSLYNLCNTILYNINKEYKGTGLLSKKRGLFSIFMKKPKEVKK